jgi:hypothetical protein
MTETNSVPGRPSGGRRMLAIGTWGGVTSGFAGIPEGHGVVRLAGNLISLDPDEHKIWAATRLALAEEPLLKQATLDGVANPFRTLADLQAEGLVIAAADGLESAHRIARQVTATLIGELVGNGPHWSPQFAVRASAASPPTMVDVLVYQFLLVADGSAPIADLCTKIGTVPPDGADLVEHVTSWLPTLLRSGLVRLDVPARETGPRP